MQELEARGWHPARQWPKIPAMELPDGVVVAQGDLGHVRDMRRLLREHGITAKLVRPPGRSGGG